MSFNIIGKDIWTMITWQLTKEDLLHLRQTCNYFKTVVTDLNTRWYQAYQWFIVSTLHKPNSSKCAVRVHAGHLRKYCIPYDHPKLAVLPFINPMYAVTINNIIAENDVTICKRKTHWHYKIPESEQDIPIDKNFDKKKKYLYFYLIACYRHHKKKHTDHLDMTKDNLQQLITSEQYLTRQLQHTKSQIIKSKNMIDRLSQKYADNTVFDKVTRIDTYNNKKKK